MCWSGRAPLSRVGGKPVLVASVNYRNEHKIRDYSTDKFVLGFYHYLLLFLLSVRSYYFGLEMNRYQYVVIVSFNILVDDEFRCHFTLCGLPSEPGHRLAGLTAMPPSCRESRRTTPRQPFSMLGIHSVDQPRNAYLFLTS